MACAPVRSSEGQDSLPRHEWCREHGCLPTATSSHRRSAKPSRRSSIGLPRRWGGSGCLTWPRTSPRANGSRTKTWWCLRKEHPAPLGLGSPELPEITRPTGPRVICGGSMEIGSSVLGGGDRSCGARHARIDEARGGAIDVPCTSEENRPGRAAPAAEETARHSGQGHVEVGARGGSRPGLQRDRYRCRIGRSRGNCKKGGGIPSDREYKGIIAEGVSHG